MTLLAPKTAAERLGISTSRVIQLDREGVLPAMRDSTGRRFFRCEDVERVAAERAQARGRRITGFPTAEAHV